jgi:hypothetical protein
MSKKNEKVVAKTALDNKNADKSKSNHVKTADEVEKAKLNIERERLELQKAIETSKLELEKLKLEREQKFWNKNSGTLITALVSLAAVIVSLGQVVSTWISQDKQLQIATLQKGQEIEMIDRQRAKELSLMDEQNRREWNLSAAKFIADNRKVLFEGSPQEQQLLANVIGTMYPPDIASSLLERIAIASPPSKRNIWRGVRQRLVQAVNTATQNPSSTSIVAPFIGLRPLQFYPSPSLSPSPPQSTPVRPQSTPILPQSINRQSVDCGGGRGVSCHAYRCECVENVGCTGYDSQGRVVEDITCPSEPLK